MKNNNKKRNSSHGPFHSVLSYIIPLIIILLVFSFMNGRGAEPRQISHGQLIKELENKNVSSLVYQGDVLQGVLKDKDKTHFQSIIPTSYFPDFYESYIKEAVEKEELTLLFQEPRTSSPFWMLLPDLLFIGLMAWMFYETYKKTQQATGNMNQFSQSKAKMNQDKRRKISFHDVAGMKEEKEELEEVVDFLKSPQKYAKVGARIPKGVLLIGSPGTGKTYLSRAVAGEAGVPFYSISGSNFVEMFVGVGAARVRDLFSEARKNAPCIVFIDEIDAVGRRRGAGLGGGNDEREQTLNQLLVEMDGFDGTEGIIVMAATNRPDILDPALTRPGRFDRTIYVAMPDVREREEILKVHLRNKPVDEDVDLSLIARQTGGFSPADLANMANEAALLTARYNETTIHMKTFQEAAIKVVAGPARKSQKVLEKERELTAYHEAGHAIVTRAIPGYMDVNLITIVPRGMAGGFTSFLPEDDKSFISRNEMKSSLVSLLAGRAAEALKMDDISTGASNDIERATDMARDMVTKYGFSPTLGPVTYERGDETVFLGNDLGRVRSYSEKTAQEIDSEVRALMRKAYERAEEVLKANDQMLNQLAGRLLEEETVHQKEFEALFEEYGVSFGGQSKLKREAALAGEGESSEPSPQPEEGGESHE